MKKVFRGRDKKKKILNIIKNNLIDLNIITIVELNGGDKMHEANPKYLGQIWLHDHDDDALVLFGNLLRMTQS